MGENSVESKEVLEAILDEPRVVAVITKPSQPVEIHISKKRKYLIMALLWMGQFFIFVSICSLAPFFPKEVKNTRLWKVLFHKVVVIICHVYIKGRSKKRNCNRIRNDNWFFSIGYSSTLSHFCEISM